MFVEPHALLGALVGAAVIGAIVAVLAQASTMQVLKDANRDLLDSLAELERHTARVDETHKALVAVLGNRVDMETRYWQSELRVKECQHHIHVNQIQRNAVRLVQSVFRVQVTPSQAVECIESWQPPTPTSAQPEPESQSAAAV